MHRLVKFFSNSLLSITTITIFLTSITTVCAAKTTDNISKKNEKARWEAGALLATFYGPLYPASAETQQKLLPVPFLIYRGKRIRVGEDGLIKATAVKKPRFKVDLSLGAAFNSNSDDSIARKGMPDLDFIFEVGPEVSFLLFSDVAHETWLNFQIRKVFSTDFSSIEERGYIFQPVIRFNGDNILNNNSSLTMTISPLFASEKMQQYFYQVDDEFSTPKRPFYQAKGGYLGSEIALVNRFNIRRDLMVFVSTKLGFYRGASNVESPLFEKELNYSIGAGIKWTLFQSNKASLF